MDGLIIPLTHACTLVTLNYIALKIRNRLIIESYEWLAVPLLTGLASVIMMIQPGDNGLLDDMRFAPIVMAGLRFGLGISLFSALTPALFSLFVIHEPNGLLALLHSLLLPAVISSLLHKREYDTEYAIIPMRDGLKVCAALTIARIALLAYQTPGYNDYLLAQLIMFFVSVGVITILIYMFNDENRNWVRERQLELQANQDGLTRLPNNRSFMTIAASTMKRRKATIFMIDIDNFKSFNDTYGHLLGDQLLRHVGQTLRATIDERDYVARYGGEEFIVLSHMTNPDDIADYAANLCRRIAAEPFYSYDAPDRPTVTISIGASTSTRHGDELQRIISEADNALYTSKRTGKNKYTIHSRNLYRPTNNA